jgi:hypothetical protein
MTNGQSSDRDELREATAKDVAAFRQKQERAEVAALGAELETISAQQAKTTKFKKTQIPFAELIALIGERAAVRLCKAYGGRRVPSLLKFLQVKRDQAVLRAHAEGVPAPILIMRFNIPPKRLEKLLRLRRRLASTARAKAPTIRDLLTAEE